MRFERITNCTLIIITHERSNLLKKSIKFYENFFLKIIVLDSSLKKNENVKSSINYEHCKNFSITEKVIYGLSKITTEFVIISSDDDYFMPMSIKDGIKFLEENLEFTSLAGKYFSFERVGILKKFNLMYKNNYKSIVYQNPIERLKFVCTKPISQMTYNLFRTETIYKALYEFKSFKHVTVLEDSITLSNILFGKHKFLEVNWMIRDGLVNTIYGKQNDSESLLANDSADKKFCINNFKLSYLKILSSNKIDFNKKLIDEYLNNYFSRYTSHTKILFKKSLIYEILKKIYKIIKYSFFYYRYFFFFSKDERKVIKLIFK